MSVFNFETFGAGHIPPFGFKASPRQTILSDDIEDVDYVDISDINKTSGESRKSQSYDKKARDLEIFEYSTKRAKEFKKDDPYFELSFGVLFSIGAHWADDNPISKYKNSLERVTAFSEEVDNIQKKMESKAGKELPELNVFTICAASLGFHWANDNPPKYY